MHISVFGGSAPKPNEPAYQEAYQLGQLIGEAGHAVLTGGYIGTMEAVSRGAAEAGGHVIGVTCDEIEVWRGVEPNPWIMEEIRFPSVRERLYKLIEGCDAAFALPGGVGTLAEIAVMWNQIQTHAIHPRPLILIGEGWKDMFERWYTTNEAYIPPSHRQLISFAPDVHEAFNQLTLLPDP
jgi:uncharacterized protein (TIGR00730 family)